MVCPCAVVMRVITRKTARASWIRCACRAVVMGTEHARTPEASSFVPATPDIRDLRASIAIRWPDITRMEWADARRILVCRIPAWIRTRPCACPMAPWRSARAMRDITTTEWAIARTIRVCRILARRKTKLVKTMVECRNVIRRFVTTRILARRIRS